jgi:hypothetical protein
MSGNKFQIKRTGIAGRQPNTTNSSNSAYIDVGELALNFSDFILYSSDGNTAFEIGANVTNQNITGTLSANGSFGSNGQVLTSNGSGIYWGVGGGGGASISEWTEITSDYIAENGDRLLADTTANSFVVTLPATPDVGDSIQIADGGNWSVNNLAIDRNGETIEGDANNLILDVGDILVYFIYGGNGPTWQVKATLGEKGETGNTGPPGIEISNTEPTNTEILWADTSEPGEIVLPSGGTTGQYLIKASNGDFDTEWSDLEEVDLSAVNTDIIPTSSDTYDLGSANNTWRDLYLSGNSIFLGNVTISETEWDSVSTGVLPYDGTISGLSANTVGEAIDETVALTNTAYTNAVSYTDNEITALGLGSIASQDANNVNINGGSIQNTTVNATSVTGALNSFTSSISTGDWSQASGSDPYIATKTVSGILSTDVPVVDIDLSNVAFASVGSVQGDWSRVYRVEASADNQIKLYSFTQPSNTLDINILVTR